MINLSLRISSQEPVEVPALGEGTQVILGDSAQLFGINATLPDIWMASNLLNKFSDLLGDWQETEEARIQAAADQALAGETGV